MRFSFSLTTCLCLAATMLSCSVGNEAGNSITDLRCEYQRSPLTVDVQAPRFTWIYDGVDGFVQHSYSLAVASSEEKLSSPDIWCSGTVTSSVPFARMEDTGLMVSDHEYFWQVTAWNADSTKVLVSEPAKFRTALMGRTDWKAVWVTDSHDKDFEAAPMFRKEFDAGQDVVSARVYMSACAYAEVRLNGEPVSDAFLDPGYTHYDKRNLYTVTDVTGKVRSGENVITAVLGNGFYNEIKPVATWNFENARWRGRARFILELHVTHADGTTSVIASDKTWKTTADGPYISNNIYSGDTYDARKEIAGWYETGFDDSSWSTAREVPDPSPLLVAQKMPQIRPTEEIEPVAVRSFGDTSYIFDFGKNISGVCRLRVSGEAGTEVSVIHAELVKEDGSLEPGEHQHLLQASSRLRVPDRQVHPQGKRHRGMDSVLHLPRIPLRRGQDQRPDEAGQGVAPCAVLLHGSGIRRHIRMFQQAAGHPLEHDQKNLLQQLHVHPDRLPSREKNGWTADAYLSQEIGLLNYDSILAYEKWLDDFIDNQKESGQISGIIPTSDWGYDDWIGPVWDAAMFIIPYNLYLYYGDKTIIEKVWPMCERYLAYLKAREDPDGLVSYGIGDWLPYEAKTPTEFTSALFYYYDYRIMKEFSFILSKESSTLMANEDRLRNAINKKFYNPETGVYASGTQTGQAAALYVKVVPGPEIPKVVAKLEEFVKDNDGHLNFGSMGSKVVLRTLTEYGLADLAYEMASKEDHPSWLAWIHDGYTSLAETWTLSQRFNDASLDHIFFGDISAWLVNDIVGIRKDDLAPGFGHIIIAPHFVEGLEWANASYNSVRGLIKAGWKKDGRKIHLDVTIPENTTATVRIDGGSDRQLRPGTHRITIDR